MKQIKLLIAGLVCMLTVSCKKNFLDDTKPDNKISDADVWKSPELALKVINGAYQALPAGHTWFMMMSATDEGMFQYNDLGTPYTHGLVTPQNLGCFARDVWAWGNMDWNPEGTSDGRLGVYRNIRNINLAIANLDQVPFKSQDERNKAIADAHFLRGFSYFLLMAQYGGVILYDKPYVVGDDFQIPRNTFEETVNFIVSDLDKAISLYNDSEVGKIKTRADKGVAMAIKAKVLLYAASDLHNSEKNGALTTGYAHPELVGYAGGNASARWQAAKAAAKAVIDLNKYHLYTGNANKVRNFEEVFVKRSDEDIFLRYYDQLTDYYYALGRTPEWQAPGGYDGAGANAVLGNLADAFEMADGSKFSWDNPALAASPYVNRDPRLYASILFEGSSWYTRSGGSAWFANAGAKNTVRVGTWPDGSTGPDAQFTNYWMKKYSDVNNGIMGYYEFNKCPPWVRMRYAEVLLNYAEACIELNEDAEARTYINMVRDRAGMPPVTESGAALKERYRNERRVELAFEEQRFFDVRRWLIGPQSGENGYGVEVKYPVQGTFDNPAFKKVVIDGGRTWVNKEYLLPFSTDELNKNKALIQNPGY